MTIISASQYYDIEHVHDMNSRDDTVCLSSVKYQDIHCVVHHLLT